MVSIREREQNTLEGLPSRMEILPGDHAPVGDCHLRNEVCSALIQATPRAQSGASNRRYEVERLPSEDMCAGGRAWG